MTTSKASLVRYTSGALFELAAKSRDRAAADEGFEALATVVLSAMALEAFLNDYIEFIDLTVGAKEPLELAEAVAVCRELEQANHQLPAKLRIVYRLLTHRELAKGCKIYQDFNLLIKLRNRIVHKRPEATPLPLGSPDREQTKLVRQLTSRHLIAEPYPRYVPFLSAYLATPAVASWAYATSVHIANLLVESLPDCRTKEALAHVFSTVLSGGSLVSP